MNLMDARDRYERDAAFRSAVDMMMAVAMRLEMSPGELREAAVFAEIKVQAMRPLETILPGRSQEIEGMLLRHDAERKSNG